MSLRVGALQHGVRVLHASGEVDVLTATSFEELLAPQGPLVLDLTDVTFCDSSGVRLLSRVARAHAEHGSGFRVVAPPGSRTRRVLDIVGMGKPLVADDVPSAAAQLRAGRADG